MGKILDALNAIYKSKKRLDGLTQKELGKKLGVAQPAVAQYLKGDTGITIELLERFCDALNVKLSDLENWNPELAEIRFSAENTAEKAPPELAKAIAKLSHLYKANRPAFDGVAGTIDVWLKQSAKPGEADETPVEPIQQDSPKKREVA